MLKTALPFPPTEQAQWIAQLHKELQHQADLLYFKDPIEGLEIDLTRIPEALAIPPKRKETWSNLFRYEIEEEKEANRILLAALMEGASALLLTCHKASCNWEQVLENIEVAYIDCWIQLNDVAHLHQFEQPALAAKKAHIQFLYSEGVARNFFSAFDLQQIGASISTQLSALLWQLHRDLENNALKSHYIFELGIGSQYFLEVAKFRTFRQLISRLEAIHQVTISYELLACTGFSNKSLKDPFTNLLRQATEALSAVIGTCDAIAVQPYDALSTDGPDDFSRRMALNIGNLIQEESQLKTTADPLKDAHVVEALTAAFTTQSWEALILADQYDELTAFTPLIAHTREARIERHHTGQQLLIGVNQFENTFETKIKQWANIPTYLGFPYLIYELV